MKTIFWGKLIAKSWWNNIKQHKKQQWIEQETKKVQYGINIELQQKADIK